MAEKRPLADRFFEKVDIRGPDDCWEWQAAANRRKSGDYGRITVRKGKAEFAHRVSYLIHFGEIPSGASICHRCNNSICVNPRHLYLGDQKTNAADRIRSGNQKGGALPGERHHRSKLTDRQRMEIHTLSNGGAKTGAVAKRFGISGTHVLRIKRDKRWVA